MLQGEFLDPCFLERLSRVLVMFLDLAGPPTCNQVYNYKPRNLDELKTAIIEQIAAIPTEMLVRVIQDFQKTLELCIQNYGNHLNDIILHI